MTISRRQMNRQLYGLGSLVKKITRGAKKAVKKVAGGIGAIEAGGWMGLHNHANQNIEINTGLRNTDSL